MFPIPEMFLCTCPVHFNSFPPWLPFSVVFRITKFKRAFITLAYSMNFYGGLHDFLSWDLAIEANHDYENVQTNIVLNQAKLLISCFPVKISINCFSLAFTKS